ncbi:MAG: hypothetical protein Q4D41_03070 [Prevotellaceae bacterium]|nr:hypothetical protein [Prevotellaceae bacterium]
MKKSLGFLIVFSLLALMFSCGREEIKICKGKVKSATDSLIVAQLGDYEIKFDAKQAEYTHGAVMAGDSVRINYVGDLKTKRVKAVIVYLIPEQGNVVDAVYDPNKELKTAPMDEAKRKDLEDFVKLSKKRNR